MVTSIDIPIAMVEKFQCPGCVCGSRHSNTSIIFRIAPDSSAPRRSKKSVQELLEDLFQVSEFSYRRVKSALEEAYATEELV